jgi:hypothetical protein
MLRLRAIALAGALCVAAIVNVFLAPQIYSPRAPVFSGADMAASDEWRGHAFSFQPSWLAANLPNSTFSHVRIGQPDWAPADSLEIGILWNTRTVSIENLSTDDSDFPLDLSDLGVRDQIAKHHQHSALIRCQSDPVVPVEGLCEYFVAFDDTVNPDDPLTFVGVFTVTGSDTNVVGFIEEGLLERLVASDLSTIPTIGEER